MRPEIELLKHHRQVCADTDHLVVITGVAVSTGAFPRDGFAAEKNVTFLAVFKQVGTTQKRGFTRPRRADQRNHMTGRGHDIHAFENLKVSVGFVQVANFDNGCGVSHVLAAFYCCSGE